MNIEKILRSEELRSEFITAINHELRTPLTISKAGVDILLDKIPGGINEEQEKLLVMARNNLIRLTKVIENLPDFISGNRESLL
jgi:K+-sensing histidine kinase KdpD